LAAILHSPAIHASRDAAKISMKSERLAILDCELEAAYNRCYELEDMAAQLGG
jgi:hypothetical protein